MKATLKEAGPDAARLEEVTSGPPPAELLIPEARQRQRSRYRRRTALGVIAAVVVVVLLVAGLSVLGTRGPSALPGTPAAPAAAGVGAGPVLVRPVLCFTPAAGAGARPAALPGTCPWPYAATAAAVQPSADASGSYKVSIVPDDPALTRVATSAGDAASRVVLLPFAVPSRGRLLLGPAVLRLSASTVSAVHLVPGTTSDAWTVRMDLSSSAAVRLDSVAHRYFHTYLAIDVGGKVVGDPLVEPTQVRFSSLNGQLDLIGGTAGGLNGALARELAKALGR
jgi:hypothetical protein